MPAAAAAAAAADGDNDDIVSHVGVTHGCRSLLTKLDGWHSIEVQTHAGHKIVFNIFLHFVTL